MSTFTTERLILRPITEADKASLKKLIFDKEGVKFIRYRNIQTDEEFNDKFTEHFLNNPDVFGIEEKSTNELIGFFEFHYDSDEPNVTYALIRSKWAQGFAAEAGKPLIDFALHAHDIHEIFAYHAEQNMNSGRVMEKMGMHFVEKWDDISSVDGSEMTIYKYKKTDD